MGIFPGLALSFLGGWLGGFISQFVAVRMLWLGAVVGFAISIYGTTALWTLERKRKRLADADRADSKVEILTVATDQVVELICHGDHEPCLVFNLGDNQLLYLRGQWIWDHSTYIDAPVAGGGNEEYFNLLEPPDSFPADTFLVTRLPNSGHVFSIQVTGEYLEPDRPIDALESDFCFNASEVIPGVLEDIPKALQSAHLRRRAN